MIDYTGITHLPAQAAETVPGVNQVFIVEISNRIGKLSIRPIGADAKIQFGTTLNDGDPLAGEYSTCPADYWLQIDVNDTRSSGIPQATRYAITSATAGIRVETTVEGGGL